MNRKEKLDQAGARPKGKGWKLDLITLPDGRKVWSWGKPVSNADIKAAFGGG